MHTLHAASDAEKSLGMLIRSLQKRESYKTHFLIPHKGDKLLPLAVEQVQYFYIADGTTKAVVSDRESYVLPHTLDELTESLDPARFFRQTGSISYHAARYGISISGSITGWPSTSKSRPTTKSSSANSASTNSRHGLQAIDRLFARKYSSLSILSGCYIFYPAHNSSVVGSNPYAFVPLLIFILNPYDCFIFCATLL